MTLREFRDATSRHSLRRDPEERRVHSCGPEVRPCFSGSFRSCWSWRCSGSDSPVDRSNCQIKGAPEFSKEKHLGDPGYHQEVGSY
ncbi:hypothetical protein GCM10010326_64830 [Streptomyces xanthochromogenes]|uniref:Uncharacterized protein n=1 Tax=Streptomyces xanthochromogenes TaxID=67384 RepID=A0ABQ3AMX7_9ACTN|nr:hypothetical protein GCM10010326_64830 [Streptomyces xanthochromogenes]